MAMTGNYWGAWDFIVVLGVLTSLWLAVLLLDELLIRFRAHRAVQRFSTDSGHTAHRPRARQPLG